MCFPLVAFVGEIADAKVVLHREKEEVCCRPELEYISGLVKMGLVERLPVNGVDMLLGNDLVKGDKIGVPIVRTELVREVDVCVTMTSGVSTDEEDLGLDFGNCNGDLASSLPPQVNLQRKELIKEQREDESLKPYFEKARLHDGS